ncbi:hypothetical protein K503DRAFT_553352 [Rhizopogon vinicolor AM-OR11-026]|uniref:Uncharacterized protein n=1 Tax=Rhizopogon vinicolor AM-OR11-026 TaxID=1314800 RepID=A0A1B7MKH8_9AGAM|nr:hypothetical protein K503DRAFT_553352 [Rhizopogon vinicolor AM-OR11-026]
MCSSSGASLWQTANQKRCHALLWAGRLAEVFEAFRYITDMSDETTRANYLDWSIGFMQELSLFRDYAQNSTPNICRYEEEDDENGGVSDLDSDIDYIDDGVC